MYLFALGHANASLPGVAIGQQSHADIGCLNAIFGRARAQVVTHW